MPWEIGKGEFMVQIVGISDKEQLWRWAWKDDWSSLNWGGSGRVCWVLELDQASKPGLSLGGCVVGSRGVRRKWQVPESLKILSSGSGVG